MPPHGPAIGEDTAPESESVALLKACVLLGLPCDTDRTRRYPNNARHALLAPRKPTLSTGPCPPTVAGPYAAWMPRKSLQGRTCSVSRDGGRARALQPSGRSSALQAINTPVQQTPNNPRFRNVACFKCNGRETTWKVARAQGSFRWRWWVTPACAPSAHVPIGGSWRR